MAGIAYDLYKSSEIREKILEEFREKKVDYRPMYEE
jgi:aminobenzoyl-glutamate utilization protein B